MPDFESRGAQQGLGHDLSCDASASFWDEHQSFEFCRVALREEAQPPHRCIATPEQIALRLLFRCLLLVTSKLRVFAFNRDLVGAAPRDGDPDGGILRLGLLPFDGSAHWVKHGKGSSLL